MSLTEKDKEALRVRLLTEKADYLTELLAEFGATLHGFDPGILAKVLVKDKQHNTLAFEALEWAWLEPLLVELRRRRKLKMYIIEANSAEMNWIQLVIAETPKKALAIAKKTHAKPDKYTYSLEERNISKEGFIYEHETN